MREIFCCNFFLARTFFAENRSNRNRGNRMLKSLAAVTSGLLTIVKTGITIVSYFGKVTASLFALTIVRKFTPR